MCYVGVGFFFAFRVRSEFAPPHSADFVVAPVVEPGGAGALVIGHPLGDFQPAAVLQTNGNPGSPEGMAADLRPDAGLGGPQADHPPDIGLEQGIASQLARAP